MLKEGDAYTSHSTLTSNTGHYHFICGKSKKITKDINQRIEGPILLWVWSICLKFRLRNPHECFGPLLHYILHAIFFFLCYIRTQNLHMFKLLISLIVLLCGPHLECHSRSPACCSGCDAMLRQDAVHAPELNNVV
jgi:hypothetical protein